MSVVVPLMRAVVRDELAGRRPLALAAVTAVTTNADGNGQHNVEVNAQLHGSELELQRVPVAAGRVGLSAAPRVGDTVIVAFVAGDLNGPVVIASLHDDQRHPPQAEPDEIVYQVPDDAGGSRRVEVVTAKGHTVTITDEAVKIVLGGTTFEMKADGDVTVEAAGNITLTASGDLTLEAQGDVAVKAGRNLQAEAQMNATLQASVQATVKGSLTAINGTTSFGM